MKTMTRREMMGALGGMAAAGRWANTAEAAQSGQALPEDKRPFLFKVRATPGVPGASEKLGFMYTDGTGFRVFDFGRPNEIGWGAYDFFKDGNRALLMSIETNEDWKTKPFQEYYPKSRTHLWACDLMSGALTEIAQKERIAPFYAPCALLPGEERLLVTIEMQGCGQLFSMNLDGTNAKRITAPNEYVYGVSVHPDGKRIAFHADYQINVMSIEGTERVAVTKRPGLLHFGTSWSPDGEWILYQVCDPAADPGHDWSDIWIGRPDGLEDRPLTQGNAAWFASSYGAKDNAGNGSIMPRWAPDGSGILCARRRPDSKTPWEFQTQRPDTTHFNRDFRPELARGGAQISFLNPKDGSIKPLTHLDPPQWEFRPEWSPDSQRILFCRAKVGENPAIWIMDRGGGNERFLTNGVDGQGGEFPRFLRG